ncbi:ATPase/histidine kinase/DNA gyrase B/HSP90 domain containing protein, partial [Acanthamoeba castellanii str. Neff]
EGLPPQAEENVRMIHESVELEVQLIDDLLDLTKISRNKLELHLQEVVAHELLSRTLQIVGHEIKLKKLHVSTDFAATIDRLNADPARLQQVFWNITKNAIKFTPEGGAIAIRTRNYEAVDDDAVPSEKEKKKNEMIQEMRKRIQPHGTCGGGGGGGKEKEAREAKEAKRRLMLAVEIMDTGIGIEDHVLPHLFRAFEQGDASITVRFGGLGLGLSISRSLVEMHQGTLSAASQGKNKGATFTIHLPVFKGGALPSPTGRTSLGSAEIKLLTPQLKSSYSVDSISSGGESSGFSPLSSSSSLPTVIPASNSFSPPTSPRGAAGSPGPPPPRDLKVLLVEDNKSTLVIMSRLLRQKLNYDVVVASSVGDALRAADEARGEFDLVISDIGLPDGTGLQLMTTLKAKYNLKGIALSGYGMDEDVQRSADAGFELHLTKPVHFASLLAAIHALHHHQPPSAGNPQPTDDPPFPSDHV